MEELLGIMDTDFWLNESPLASLGLGEIKGLGHISAQGWDWDFFGYPKGALHKPWALGIILRWFAQWCSSSRDTGLSWTTDNYHSSRTINISWGWSSCTLPIIWSHWRCAAVSCKLNKIQIRTLYPTGFSLALTAWTEQFDIKDGDIQPSWTVFSCMVRAIRCLLLLDDAHQRATPPIQCLSPYC